MRTVQLLNSGWTFRGKDEKPVPVTLPHTWNSIDGQDGGNDYYRGTCEYTRKLAIAKPADGSRVYLQFDGAAMTAHVTLNGEEIAVHEGGFSAFRVDITDHLTGEDTLRVLVDNGKNQHVYPQQADFTFYGGLYRSVKLVTVPEQHFDLDYYGGMGFRVTPETMIEEGSGKNARARARVTLEAWANGTGDVTFEAAGQKVQAPLQNGKAEAVITIENAHLWDGIDDPYLYEAEASLPSGDHVRTRFGCRTFRIDPSEGFFLNGRAYPLRGVSRHQDRQGLGNALTTKEHREDISMILEVGANAVRLAHYQHAEEFYDLCDEKGLIVWAEIPYITMHMKEGRENTLSQMKELVVQNYNHPCIAVWGLSNEITAAPCGDDADLLENHRELNDLVHRLDPTRPTTMANVFMLETDSPLLEIPDVSAYNLYYGWYLGELHDNEDFFDEYHRKYPNRAVGLSEFGADANPAFHSDKPHAGDYSEEYACVYHEHMLHMVEKRPWIWCVFVWNMFDFAADGRDEGGKHGQNQKGLVTFDRKIRKDAFYLYKAFWSREPFVHICGRRFVDRTGDGTEIKVYSNQNTVRLYVNGKLFEEKSGDRIFSFCIPLTGEETIEAVSGYLRDQITIRKVKEPNSAYSLPNAPKSVTNWFDLADMNADCYSIEDRLSDLMADPEAGPLVREIMEKGGSTRGDVAASTSGNKNLQRMMGRMSLRSLLSHMTDVVSEDEVKELNQKLQKIRK